MADYIGGDMIRGHIDTIILNSLIDGDKDTNQIRTEIEERAAGQFQLKQGTFYSALQRIVKQGYVLEYRTTGNDGVRHKYFQLTEKGKDHIEKTQSSWTMSQQVINTLLDADQQNSGVNRSKAKEEDEKIPVFSENTPAVTDFSNLNKKAEDSEESTAEQTINSINELEINEIASNNNAVKEEKPEDSDEKSEEITTDDQLLNEKPLIFKPESSVDSTDEVPQSFDDIMEMLEKIERDEKAEAERKEAEQEAERKRKEIEELKRAEENALYSEKTAEKPAISKQIDVFDIQKDNDKEELDKLLREKEELTATIDQLEERLNSDYEEKQSSNIFNFNDDSENQVDDYLDAQNFPEQKEYRDVLSRIFASEKQKEPAKNVVEFPKTMEKIDKNQQDSSEKIENNPIDDEKYDVIVDKLEFSQAMNESQQKAMRQSNAKLNKKKKGNGIDYSDIIALSENEGFKVTTSDRTNKSELGKILINRLNFHTSIIFFIVLAIEILVIGVAMENVLAFGFQTYIYAGLIALLFPIVCGVIYYMAPKRVIGELIPFKGSFETAIIITLNLVLLILVYTVVIDLDFSSTQDITRHLFLPVLAVLNIPLLVIIRYSLLEKQMYFS